MDVNEALELADGSHLAWAPVLAEEVRSLRRAIALDTELDRLTDENARLRAEMEQLRDERAQLLHSLRESHEEQERMVKSLQWLRIRYEAARPVVQAWGFKPLRSAVREAHEDLGIALDALGRAHEDKGQDR